MVRYIGLRTEEAVLVRPVSIANSINVLWPEETSTKAILRVGFRMPSVFHC